MTDPRNLSGVWYGRYDATGYDDTNDFIARIDDSDDGVTGVITEPDTSGQTDIRRAFVDGRRSGDRVDFVKQYDGAAMAHAVRYAGLVNADATEIVGRWAIVRHHGTFVMRREKFSVEELTESEEKTLPVS